MSVTFKAAVRENVGLIIGLAGASGSGKTFTAFRLAAGIAGDKPFAVIDTENRRALHYADKFRFDHAELREPFTPEAYAEAIEAADKAGYPAIVVDSMSHEWAGEGGLLDMQDAEFQRMGARDSAKMASWIKPKASHKRLLYGTLLQVRAHLILCFRAEEKIEMVKRDGRTEIVPKQGVAGFKGWLPICEKSLPYELTASFLFVSDKPGVPQPIKLQDQHRALFPLDQPITEESGRLIAEWAVGAPVERITADQVAALELRCQDNAIPLDRLKAAAKVSALADIRADAFKRADEWITAVIAKRQTSRSEERAVA